MQLFEFRFSEMETFKIIYIHTGNNVFYIDG